MQRLIPITDKKDIPEGYRNTPIEYLVEYHNLGRKHDAYEKAAMLIGMCMDNRKALKIPHNFSYVIRTGGANLRYNDFKVSYAIAVGGVRYIALIGHTQCGMVKVRDRKELFVQGLVNIGWDKERAIEHFEDNAPKFEISNEVDFVLSDVERLRKQYPSVMVAPLLYKVEDNKLYFIREVE